MNLFSREPTQSIDIQKRFLDTVLWAIIIDNLWTTRYKIYAQFDYQVFFRWIRNTDMLDQTTLPMGHIARMDVYDGYDASIYGAHIVAFKSKDGSQPVATTHFQKNKQNKFTVQGYTKLSETR
jgi:hypothetical protein